MSSPPDYVAATVPPEKDPTDYTYVERRADLLDRIITAGSPRAIHQGRLAELYGVSEAQLSKDMDRLAADVRAQLANDIELATYAIYEHTIDRLHADEKYEEAWQVHLDWVEFLERWPGTGAADGPSTDGHGDATTAAGGPGELSEQNKQHFDALLEAATEATEPFMNTPDDPPARG